MISRVGLGVVIVALACIAFVAKASAEPLVTITCDKPDGFTLEYGIPYSAHLEAAANNQPEPTKPILTGPTNDGYASKPTFVIDADRKKMTVIWNELPQDLDSRKFMKKLGLPQMPPPPASDAIIVQFLPDAISAIQAEHGRS